MFWLMDKIILFVASLIVAKQETPEQHTVRMAVDPPPDAVVYQFRNGQVRFHKGQLMLVDRLGIVKAVRHKSSFSAGATYLDPREAASALYTEFWPVQTLTYRTRRA